MATDALNRINLLIMAALWILLLITAAGLKINIWFSQRPTDYLRCRRAAAPGNFGIPLDFVDVFGNTSVMQVLLEV